MARRRRRRSLGATPAELRARYESKYLIRQSTDPREGRSAAYLAYLRADKNLGDGAQTGTCSGMLSGWLKYKFNRGVAESGMRMDAPNEGNLSIVRQQVDAKASKYGDLMQNLCRFSKEDRQSSLRAGIDKYASFREQVRAKMAEGGPGVSVPKGFFSKKGG